MWDWLLAIMLSLLIPQTGSPRFAFALNTGPLPEENYSCDLLGARTWGSFRWRYAVEELQRVDDDWSLEKVYWQLLGRPYVVRARVNLNTASPLDVIAAMWRIRSGWDPKKNALFVFCFYRCRGLEPLVGPSPPDAG